MAKFTGTCDDFDKFVGPRLRNVVQTSISKKYKKEIGRCEHCGKTNELQAAHITGKDRKTLIIEALGDLIVDNKLVDVDINEIEKKFKDLHQPLNETFIILCRKCHYKYDNITETFEAADIQVYDTEVNDKLNIEFDPSDMTEFQELLLQYKNAKITIFYDKDVIKVKHWDAANMTIDSNISRNLRSRDEFRQGNWQRSGIKKVLVSIDY